MSFAATVLLLGVLAADNPVVPRECAQLDARGCTLQNWMRLTVRRHLENEDYGMLAVALRRLANGAPPEQRQWQTFARLAAIAAERKDPEGVRAQCKGCHDVYRKPLGKRTGPNAY